MIEYLKPILNQLIWHSNQALLIKSQLLSSTSGRKGGELWSRAERELLRAEVITCVDFWVYSVSAKE